MVITLDEFWEGDMVAPSLPGDDLHLRNGPGMDMYR